MTITFMQNTWLARLTRYQIYKGLDYGKAQTY